MNRQKEKILDFSDHYVTIYEYPTSNDIKQLINNGKELRFCINGDLEYNDIGSIEYCWDASLLTHDRFHKYYGLTDDDFIEGILDKNGAHFWGYSLDKLKKCFSDYDMFNEIYGKNNYLIADDSK